ncbi:PDE2A phosphodiesterase, partial [Columbina picui]|nr:PDE2A phosphodiesterase [Columbina picui]
LKQETQSLSCCLLLVSEDNHQLFCQVVGDRVLEEEISFSLTFGRLGQVVEDKKSITLKDISEEEHKQLSSMLGCEVTSMLCVPVISRATSQVCSPAPWPSRRSRSSSASVRWVARQCPTRVCPRITPRTDRVSPLVPNQALLQVAKNLFTHLGRWMGCMGWNPSGMVAPGSPVPWRGGGCPLCCAGVPCAGRWWQEGGHEQGQSALLGMDSYEIRIPADQGIAGHVATTGKILNIKDAYSHPLFYRGVDDSTGFRTRNILCFPIKNESQEVIGVAELVNKINGPWFSKFDEDLATAFSIYCGISIAHVRPEGTPKLGGGVKGVPLALFPPFCFCRDIEIFALFISCMCHDLDHRGTNNSFQVASKSVLAALYSSEGSVMERHHFAQAIAILNSQGCNIFDHFSRKDYQRMLDLMRDIILATDLAHHLRIFKDLQKMAEVGYDPKNKQHHNLLLCLLMTSCDLSDQTKGWKTTRKIA